MIQVDELTYSYPRRTTPVLDNLSFTVEPGHIFTLLGPNGAGKTTLVRILATLILPLKGKVQICGYDAAHEPRNARRNIGLCSDSERSFYFRLTGYQNLEFFGGLISGITPNQLRRQINEVIELVGLDKDRNTLFMDYSHGMRKRLSLARSLLHDPQVYLLDEPTSGIDPISATDIRKIITSLKSQGKTIFVTTHNLEDASKISDTIAFLKDGNFVALDTLENLKQLIQQRRLLVTIQQPGTIPATDRGQSPDMFTMMLGQLPMVKAVHQNCSKMTIEISLDAPVTPIMDLFIKHGYSIKSFNEEAPTLEDLFLHFTKQ